MSSNVTIDDTSSSIKYTGYWESGRDRNSTVHSAWDPGSQAIFSFRGTHVAVYGIVPDGDGEVVRVDFSIDNGPVVSQSRQSGERQVMNELWFESGVLGDEEHTLVMTYLPNGANMDFRLDFIEYTPSATTPGSQSASAITITGSVGSPGASVVTQFIPVSTTLANGSSQDDSTASSAKGHAPTGVIVGGVLGGLSFLAIGVLFILVLVRRRRRRPWAAVGSEAPFSPYAVTVSASSGHSTSGKAQSSRHTTSFGQGAAVSMTARIITSTSKSALQSAPSANSATLTERSQPETMSGSEAMALEVPGDDVPPPAYSDNPER